ncbi:MAG: hypothetical protein M9918_10855 [Anaerolineae bacterium]|nr:hypothetical protein [Anaerolineae bacterium]
MKSLESNTVTFVVTIWFDSNETADGDSQTNWRGEIRDVMGVRQSRTTFTSLDTIADYIKPFLDCRGVLS